MCEKKYVSEREKARIEIQIGETPFHFAERLCRTEKTTTDYADFTDSEGPS
jgi:hypothetical protein